jgi:hypothetical protein
LEDLNMAKTTKKAVKPKLQNYSLDVGSRDLEKLRRFIAKLEKMGVYPICDIGVIDARLWSGAARRTHMRLVVNVDDLLGGNAHVGGNEKSYGGEHV